MPVNCAVSAAPLTVMRGGNKYSFASVLWKEPAGRTFLGMACAYAIHGWSQKGTVSHLFALKSPVFSGDQMQIVEIQQPPKPNPNQCDKNGKTGNNK